MLSFTSFKTLVALMVAANLAFVACGPTNKMKTKQAVKDTFDINGKQNPDDSAKEDKENILETQEAAGVTPDVKEEIISLQPTDEAPAAEATETAPATVVESAKIEEKKGELMSGGFEGDDSASQVAAPAQFSATLPEIQMDSAILNEAAAQPVGQVAQAEASAAPAKVEEVKYELSSEQKDFLSKITSFFINKDSSEIELKFKKAGARNKVTIVLKKIENESDAEAAIYKSLEQKNIETNSFIIGASIKKVENKTFVALTKVDVKSSKVTAVINLLIEEFSAIVQPLETQDSLLKILKEQSVLKAIKTSVVEVVKKDEKEDMLVNIKESVLNRVKLVSLDKNQLITIQISSRTDTKTLADLKPDTDSSPVSKEIEEMRHGRLKIKLVESTLANSDGKIEQSLTVKVKRNESAVEELKFILVNN